jgi:hypothetical protein
VICITRLSTLDRVPLYDPKSGKLEFNLEDDRNNLTVMFSDADAMAAELESPGQRNNWPARLERMTPWTGLFAFPLRQLIIPPGRKS